MHQLINDLRRFPAGENLDCAANCAAPFEKPKSGRIAVKVINHLGDEVMKVFHDYTLSEYLIGIRHVLD